MATTDRADALAAAVLRDLPGISVLLMDRDLRILLAAGGALREHGWDPERMVGRHLADLVPPPAFEELGRRCEAALAGEPQSFEQRTLDGRSLMELEASPSHDGVVLVSRDVTALRAAEQAAERERRLLADVLDSINLPVSVKDADERFLVINAEYERLQRLRREDVVGKTVFDLYDRRFAEAFHLDDARALAGDSPVVSERPASYPDGSVHTLRFWRSPLRQRDGRTYGLCAVAEDVTEKLAAEAELREARERFERAFEDAPIGMALVDLEGRFLKVNRGLCEITGYEERVLLDLTFQDITHPEDLDADLAQMRRLVAGDIRSYQMEKRYVRSTGELVWVLLAGSMVRDDAGAPLYFVAQVEDISARKRSEAELQRLADHDPLTGLWNRRRFAQELDRQLERSARFGEPAALLLVDLDGFKAVNDTYGHLVGDQVLREAADVLRGRLRATDSLGRYGGDEFVVLLPRATAPEADALARVLRDRLLQMAVPTHAGPIGVGGSVGIALIGREASAEAVVATADAALYRAKQLEERVALGTAQA